KRKLVFVAPPPPPRCCGCGSGCDGRVAVSRSRSDSRAGVCCSAVICRVAAGASGSVLDGVGAGCAEGGGCCAVRRRCCDGCSVADGGCCANEGSARRTAKINAHVFMTRIL